MEGKYAYEAALSLAHVRLVARRMKSNFDKLDEASRTMLEHFEFLDNAGVFHKLDERTGYAPPEDVLKISSP